MKRFFRGRAAHRALDPIRGHREFTAAQKAVIAAGVAATGAAPYFVKPGSSMKSEPRNTTKMGGSEVNRTTSLDQPKRTRVHIPKPPLVGVETNPGPRRRSASAGSRRSRGSSRASSKSRKLRFKPKSQKRIKIKQPGKATMRASVAPVAIGYTTTSGSLTTRPTSGGRNRVIANRELWIPQLPGSTTFAVTQNQVNPGLASIFALMAPEASYYAQYRFRKLHLVYVPIANTGISGDITLGANYDPSEPVPTSETGLTNMQGTVQGPVWSELVFKADITKMNSTNPWRYTRFWAAAGDIKTYDALTLMYAPNNCNSSAIIGKLWLDYEVEFRGQQQPQTTPIPSTVSYFLGGTLGPYSPGTTIYLPQYYSNSGTNDPLSIMATTTGSGATFAFAPPPGFYIVTTAAAVVLTTFVNYDTAYSFLRVSPGGPLSHNYASLSVSSANDQATSEVTNVVTVLPGQYYTLGWTFGTQASNAWQIQFTSMIWRAA